MSAEATELVEKGNMPLTLESLLEFDPPVKSSERWLALFSPILALVDPAYEWGNIDNFEKAEALLAEIILVEDEPETVEPSALALVELYCQDREEKAVARAEKEENA